MSAVTVMMLSVVITMRVRIIGKCAFGKGFRRFICGSLHTGKEPDTGITKSHLRAHTDSAADQSVYICCQQESGKRTVPISIGINNLFVYDLPVLDIIQLKLLGMSKMLKDLPIVISNCDSHCSISFLNNILIDLYRFIFTVSACDQKPFAINERIRDLLSGAVIDCRDRSTGNMHSVRAGLLCQTHIVQKPQRLKLVHGHENTLRCICVIRREAAVNR